MTAKDYNKSTISQKKLPLRLALGLAVPIALLTTGFLVGAAVPNIFTRNFERGYAAQFMLNKQEPLNSKVKVADKPAKLSISVKEFGAVGNGKADDTRAIQRAIDAVYKVGGGVVFFPQGTYKVTVNPSTLQAITIRTKVTLKGIDRRKSIIKLADRQGNYNSILAGAKFSSDLSDFAMYDLTIDSNATNNPVTSESDFIPLQKKGSYSQRIFAASRYALRIYVGKRIHIEHCRFTDQNNRNTITANGTAVADIWITHNIFDLVGGATVDHDHSTIYAHGKRIYISNNFFASRNGAGTKAVWAAIETHGDKHTVTFNKITGYRSGMNVTGIANSSNGQTVTGNVIKDVYRGIVIWSYFYGSNTANPALTNCTIANNKISLNVDAWRSLVRTGGPKGIVLDTKSNAPIKNLNIINNHIYFTNFSGKGRFNDNLSNGINLWRYANPNIITENLRVSGNTIKGSLAAGIYVFMPVKGGEISRNIIVNPARSNGSFHEGYRKAIIVDGVVEDFQIYDNLIAYK
jgi:hypothetical protein